MLNGFLALVRALIHKIPVCDAVPYYSVFLYIIDSFISHGVIMMILRGGKFGQDTNDLL